MTHSLYPLTLYYDGACPLCMAEMRNLMLRNEREQRLRFVDIAAPAFAVPDWRDAGRPGAAAARAGVRWHLAARGGHLCGHVRGGRYFVGGAVAERAWAAAAGRPALPLGGAPPPLVSPQWLAHLVFETAMRRAAQKAVPACADGVCRRDAS